MKNQSNLRWLRLRHHITLCEMEAASDISNQYISRAELGDIPSTRRLEQQLSAALEFVIRSRKQELLLLEADFLQCRGRLLEPAEDEIP